LVKETQTAYDIVAHGMLTGEGFANKHKLSDYIIGNKADYFNARKMVNSADSASCQPIADIAVLFEEMLIEAKR